MLNAIISCPILIVGLQYYREKTYTLHEICYQMKKIKEGKDFQSQLK